MTDSKSDFLNWLEAIAESMNALSAIQSNACFYDFLSGGIIWWDELPPLGQRGIAHSHGMRPVFHYRSTYLLGQPDIVCEKYWNRARELFPLWVGFLPERCARTPDLVELVWELRQSAENPLGEPE